jgi:hypothetical protein
MQRRLRHRFWCWRQDGFRFGRHRSSPALFLSALCGFCGPRRQQQAFDLAGMLDFDGFGEQALATPHQAQNGDLVVGANVAAPLPDLRPIAPFRLEHALW